MSVAQTAIKGCPSPLECLRSEALRALRGEPGGDAGFRRAIDGIEGRLQGVIGGEAMGRLQGPNCSLPIALSKGAEEALTKALPRSLIALRRGG
jgi:hypothetical protein